MQMLFERGCPDGTSGRAVSGCRPRPGTAGRCGALNVPLRYLLDTNILSDLIREPHGAVAERISSAGEDTVCTSIVVAAELRFGAVKSGSAKLAEHCRHEEINVQVDKDERQVLWQSKRLRHFWSVSASSQH